MPVDQRTMSVIFHSKPLTSLAIPFYLLLIILLISCEKNEKDGYEELAQEDITYRDGYMGEQSCMHCHPKEFKSWTGSHHDKAMEEVSETSVLGDFNEVSVTLDGVSYFFFRKEQDFLVRIRELSGSEKEYRISYVFGITPLQQYIVDFPKGKKQVLRVSWDTVEKKWFHQYAGDEITITDWLHWTKGAQNWNTMCAECHSTNLKKDYLMERDSFNTTYSAINVSCESCHGPGEKHVKWANAGNTGKDPSLYLGDVQKTQLTMCAPCHARRVKLTKNFVPGMAFEDQYLLQNISSDYYHRDGQIREEDYVYGSFVQSKMHANAVKCSDCHDAHSLQLKFQGNNLCLQCHVKTDYDAKKHHFHQEGTEGSKCINCHMTGKYYMGNDFRRDHSFRIPRPDQSLAYGTPNACNECHGDKSEKWAADWIVSWYGPERRPHFSDYLLLSYKEDLSDAERQKLTAFINDLNYPAIARSTVIGNLNYADEEMVRALIQAMKDSSATTRYNALMQFRGLTLEDRMVIGLRHMSDSVRLVRIGAAQLLTDFDGSTLDPTDKASFFKAKGELEEMLYSNADFATGRMQLGDYYLQTGDLQAAIGHYEQALAADSLLFPVYSNLATAYSMDSRTDRAMETLSTWMDYDENSGRPYYLRALLQFELGNNDLAVQDLKMAIELDPENSRAMYNLATYQYQIRDFAGAESWSRKALRLEPDNTDFNYLLALVLKEQGKISEANNIMGKLNQGQ